MYYDKELSMMQNYAYEIHQEYMSKCGERTDVELRKINAKIWAINEIMNRIIKEDMCAPVMIENHCLYSVPDIVHQFMIDMQYLMQLNRIPSVCIVWIVAYNVGKEVCARLKALP